MIQSDQVAKCSSGSSGSSKSLVSQNATPQITVNVESVFEDGVVVCYTDSKGVEYRGAMLTQSPAEQRLYSVVKAKDVANPVTFVHDHPYSNMKRYARHITKIPRDILLNWNSLPEFLATPETESLEEIAAARKKLTELSLVNDGPQLSMPKVRSVTVLASPVNEDISAYGMRSFSGSPMDMSLLPGGRVAKKIANSKMLYGKGNFYSDCSDRAFGYRKTPSYRSKKCRSTESKVIKKSKKVSSPGINKKKLAYSTPPPENGLPRSSRKYNLKKFSIPIVRIKHRPREVSSSPSIFTAGGSSPKSSLLSSPITFSSSPQPLVSSPITSPINLSSPSTISSLTSPLLTTLLY